MRRTAPGQLSLFSPPTPPLVEGTDSHPGILRLGDWVEHIASRDQLQLLRVDRLYIVGMTPEGGIFKIPRVDIQKIPARSHRPWESQVLDAGEKPPFGPDRPWEVAWPEYREAHRQWEIWYRKSRLRAVMRDYPPEKWGDILHCDPEMLKDIMENPDSDWLCGWRAQHRLQIEWAIRDGRIVPPHILADYPDLQAKTGGKRVEPHSLL